MPSTYTLNNGIELIATGEQSGTWGDTTNTNMSLLDTALDGQVTVTLASAGTSGSPNTLPISDGAVSDGRNRMVIFNDGADLGATAYVQLTPNDAEKIVYIRNALSRSRSIIVFQGTYNASNDYEIPAGTTALVYFNGGGTGAVAANVFNNAYFDSLRLGSVSVTAILDEDDMSSDSATSLATQQSIKAYVDSQVGTVDTLAEILANGNTTGGTDISVSSGDDITFANNSKASFGGGELQIFSEGSAGNSFINETGTGSLYINATNLYLRKGEAVFENFITAIANDAVTLYYDNSAKLATTSTGIDVTGGIAATDDSTFTAASGDIYVTASTGSGTARSGFRVDETANNGFEMAHDNTDNAFFISRRSGSATPVDVIKIERSTGDIVFFENDGATASFFYDASSGLTINEAGSDRDFRVESDAASHMLFVDAGNNRVGIGEAAPGNPLHVTTSSAGDILTLESTDAGAGVGPSINLYRNSSSPAANDLGPALYWRGENSIGGQHTYANIYSQYTNVTDGTEACNLISQISVLGVPRSVLSLLASSTSVVINDESQDIDFRVESNNQTHAIFVDAGNDTVNINRSSGPAALNVQSDSGADGIAVYGRSSDNISQFTMYNSGGTGLSQIQTRPQYLDIRSLADIPVIISPNASGKFYVYSGETVVNENSADHDFRVESNDVTNMLFIDAAANTVNINNTTDFGGKLNVNGGLNRKQAVFTSTNNRGLALSTASRGGQNDGVAIIDAQDTESTGGRFEIHTMGAERARFERDQIVFNDSSNDQDFRVESDNQANMLFVEAQSDRIGIAESAPESQLHIKQTSDIGTGNSMGLMIESGTSTQRYMLQTGRTGVSNAYFNLRDVSNGRDIWSVLDTDGTFQGHTPFEWNNAAVFNNGGLDYDFRVESDNNQYALFIDASENKTTFNTSYTADGGVITIRGTYGAHNASDYRGNNALALTGADPGTTSSGAGINLAFVPVSNRGATAVISGENTGTNKEGGAQLRFSVGGSSFPTTQKDMLMLNHDNGAIFNEGSADLDFRVESDGYSNMLFVDAGLNRVGIANGSPDQSLDIGVGGLQIKGNIAAPDSGTSAMQVDYFSGGARYWSRGADATTRGTHKFYVLENDGGNQITPLIIDTTGGVILNEDSADADFRVESDGNANMLFVDAGNNCVVIGGTTAETADTFEVLSSDTVTNVRFRNTNAGADGPILIFDKASASPANDDNVGDIRFIGLDSTSNPTQYARFLVESSNVTNGAEDGTVSLEMMANGSNLQIYNHSHVGTVFNEQSSGSLDFRVETTAASHMIYANGGDNVVTFDATSFSAVDNRTSTGVAIRTAGRIVQTTTNGGNAIECNVDGQASGAGSINVSGTTTTYNTSSDARLKENIVDAPSASDDIDAIQVRSFDWKADGLHQKYGMVAQELETVAPEAVTGDANSDDMMGVDYSKLVPMLVKEIQSLRARVAQLESN